MYSYISGNLVLKKSELAVVDCNGIGYEIHIPVSTFEKLPALNSQLTLPIHYSFNESDGTKLFGFYTELERTLFRLLISISKSGPKIALAFLAGLPAKYFIGVIKDDGSEFLKNVELGKENCNVDELVMATSFLFDGKYIENAKGTSEVNISDVKYKDIVIKYIDVNPIIL